MFYDCWALEKIELPYGFANNVKSMRSMFYSCKALTTIKVDTHFYTWDVTDMGYMFYGCEKLDMSELVKGFNTRYVTDMEHMFWNCYALKSLNLKDWNMSNVKKTNSMFSGCKNLTTIYRNDDWSKLAVTNGNSMFSGCTSLKGGKGTSYNSSKTGLEMAHPDNSGVGGYFTGEETSSNQLYGVLVGTTYNIRYDKEQTLCGGISDITSLSADDADKVTTVKIESAVKNAKITSTKMWFCAMPKLTSVEGLENINWSNVTDVSYMFADDVKLPSIDLRKMNLTGKKCDYMFKSCSALTTIYCDDDYTSTLASATNMFYGCSSLKGQKGTTYSSAHTDASYARPDAATAPGYFTGKVKELYSRCDADTTVLVLYYDENCVLAEGDLYWNTKNAGKYREKVVLVMLDKTMKDYHPTSIARWFSDYTQLKEISCLTYLNTDQVTDMTETFANCYVLENLDVSHFQTTKVKSMEAMFMSCKALKELNVNGFFDFDDVSANAIKNTNRMFAFCDKLRTIYCNNDWSQLTSITNSLNMFYDSKQLLGGKGTRYDAEHTDITYARPEESASIKGYFTKFRTDIENVSAEQVSGRKVLRDGVMLIQRGEKLYTITGQEVK